MAKIVKNVFVISYSTSEIITNQNPEVICMRSLSDIATVEPGHIDHDF